MQKHKGLMIGGVLLVSVILLASGWRFRGGAPEVGVTPTVSSSTTPTWAVVRPTMATSPSTSTTRPSVTPMPSDTPAPTFTRAPTLPLTETPTPTSIPTATPSFQIATYPPNEQGQILVLAYHRIDEPEDRWTRTPANFRQDLELMLQQGYYPVNLIDVATGALDHVPYGRRPIVLTFDDSTAGHFRYLADGSLDPDCAVGVLLAMHEAYGDDWPLRATFFVLLNDADQPGAPLFRQPDLAAQKVRALVDWGFEVGSHTISHSDLSKLTDEQVRWELATSQSRLAALVPGYVVHSLSLPYGSYPQNAALLRQGYSQSAELRYTYQAVVRLGATINVSPHAPEFDPYAIARVQAIPSQLEQWFGHYVRHPERYYVSDGAR